MNRAFWKNISFKKLPPYDCPECTIGKMIATKKPSLEKITTDEEHVTHFIFTSILSCLNKACTSKISITGKYYEDIPEYDDQIRYNLYVPTFFYPNLEIFKLSETIPKNIKREMNLSFSNFFNDLSSCANRMRNAVEILLDEINAPKTKLIIKKSSCPINDTSCSKHITIVKSQEVKIRTLHERIDNYTKTINNEVGQFLMANKIIGNAGSHIGSITREDILDSYDMLILVFDILFVKNKENKRNMANQIVKDNKPRSKK